jgi:hypothetical protein
MSFERLNPESLRMTVVIAMKTVMTKIQEV